MVLIIIWLSFILLTSLCKEFDHPHYLLGSFLVLIPIYRLNRIYNIKITLEQALTILIIPSFIFWYLLFIYNSFLSLSPTDPELFKVIVLIYIVTIILAFSSIYH